MQSYFCNTFLKTPFQHSFPLSHHLLTICSTDSPLQEWSTHTIDISLLTCLQPRIVVNLFGAKDQLRLN